jgi:hypothetical protein
MPPADAYASNDYDSEDAMHIDVDDQDAEGDSVHEDVPSSPKHDRAYAAVAAARPSYQSNSNSVCIPP